MSPNENSAKVVLFGAAADRAGTREVEVEVGSGATVGTVWETLSETYPGLAPIGGTLAFAVNSEYATPEEPVSGGDEIAVLPPVSGG